MTDHKFGPIQRHRWVASLSSSGVEKAVLRVLADYANCETLQCWPSISTIVKESGFCERTVQGAIGRLVAAKVIDLLPSAGRQPNHYILRISDPPPPAGLIPAADARLQNSNPAGDAPLPRRRCEVNPAGDAPEPRIKPDKEPSHSCPSGDVLARSFEIFWAAYPRKVAKKTAREIWKRAKAYQHLDAILADLRIRKWPDERRYVMHPATYLNQERWTDEREPEARQKNDNYRMHKAGVTDV